MLTFEDNIIPTAMPLGMLRTAAFDDVNLTHREPARPADPAVQIAQMKL